MVKRIDEAYGRMIDVIKSLKLFDDSAIIFTSDHGNNFKTRNREYKRSCHESSGGDHLPVYFSLYPIGGG